MRWGFLHHWKSLMTLTMAHEEQLSWTSPRKSSGEELLEVETHICSETEGEGEEDVEREVERNEDANWNLRETKSGREGVGSGSGRGGEGKDARTCEWDEMTLAEREEIHLEEWRATEKDENWISINVNMDEDIVVEDKEEVVKEGMEEDEDEEFSEVWHRAETEADQDQRDLDVSWEGKDKRHTRPHQLQPTAINLHLVQETAILVSSAQETIRVSDNDKYFPTPLHPNPSVSLTPSILSLPRIPRPTNDKDPHKHSKDRLPPSVTPGPRPMSLVHEAPLEVHIDCRKLLRWTRSEEQEKEKEKQKEKERRERRAIAGVKEKDVKSGKDECIEDSGQLRRKWLDDNINGNFSAISNVSGKSGKVLGGRNNKYSGPNHQSQSQIQNQSQRPPVKQRKSIFPSGKVESVEGESRRRSRVGFSDQDEEAEEGGREKRNTLANPPIVLCGDRQSRGRDDEEEEEEEENREPLPIAPLNAQKAEGDGFSPTPVPVPIYDPNLVQVRDLHRPFGASTPHVVGQKRNDEEREDGQDGDDDDDNDDEDTEEKFGCSDEDQGGETLVPSDPNLIPSHSSSSPSRGKEEGGAEGDGEKRESGGSGTSTSDCESIGGAGGQLLQDKWRVLFDKFDPEGFGEIPWSDFLIALTSPHFQEAVEPGKILLLQDMAASQADSLLSTAITYQHFVNIMSGKRSRSFKCAVHQRDREVCSESDFHLLPFGYKPPTGVKRMARLIADEFLTDERDRKYYADHYRCLPPPLFIISVTLIELGFFTYYTVWHGEISSSGPLPMDSPFVYRPDKRQEVWRFLFYMVLHAGWVHLMFNLLVQLLVGLPLEMVHGSLRIGCVYMAGVLAGSLGTSVFDPDVYLVGASGGVYALLAAHLANVLLNYNNMEFGLVRLLGVFLIASVDVGFAIYDRYAASPPLTENSVPPVSYVAHLTGALAGLTIGLLVLKNFEQKLREQLMWWFALGVYAACTLFAILFNVFHPGFPYKN